MPEAIQALGYTAKLYIWILQVLQHHLNMLQKTFESSMLAVHLGYAARKLLRAWDCMSTCSKYSEIWLQNLVKQETDTIAKVNSNDEDFRQACCPRTTETAAEHMVFTAKDLMEARMYNRASSMLATATAVNPFSTTCLHTALQGRMLLSCAIVRSPSDASQKEAMFQRAIDCFQKGLNPAH